MLRVINDHSNEKVLEEVRKEVLDLCKQFPVYTDKVL